MWVIWKKVGLFEHYLNASGQFQPKFDEAKKFPSKEMADIMAKQKGGIVRSISNNSDNL